VLERLGVLVDPSSPVEEAIIAQPVTDRQSNDT
jgi:hypothetical protein